MNLSTNIPLAARNRARTWAPWPSSFALIASCLALLPGCIYGQVTQSGEPVTNVLVNLSSCTRLWSSPTQSNGGYSFNPYSTNPQNPTSSPEYVPPGNYIMTVTIPPPGLFKNILDETILYVTSVTVQDWLSVPTCINSATGEQTPCQRFDAPIPVLFNENAMKEQYSELYQQMCP